MWQQPDIVLVRPEKDSITVELYRFSQQQQLPENHRNEPTVATEIRWHAFDPNTADSLTMTALGLSPFVVKNILKYRARGGKYRQAEDLKKIYGMTPSDYDAMKPYIQIVQSIEKPLRSTPATLPEHRNALKQQSFPEHRDSLQYCDLNSADTAELIRIRGIGRYTAIQILNYRTRLGGFCSLSQLDEIPYVRPENLTELKAIARIDSAQIKRIMIDTAAFETLHSHPYIGYYQAKALVEMRKEQGTIASIEALSFLEEFSSQELERLHPYLSF